MFSISADLKTLSQVARKIIEAMPNGGILLLRGTLASGKTSFVKAFAKELGIDEAISSPTFSILNEYDKKLFHYDIYQCGCDGFLSSGLLEKLDEAGYHLIEWGGADFEAVLQRFKIGYSTLDIEIEELKRNYKVNINAYA